MSRYQHVTYCSRNPYMVWCCHHQSLFVYYYYYYDSHCVSLASVIMNAATRLRAVLTHDGSGDVRDLHLQLYSLHLSLTTYVRYIYIYAEDCYSLISSIPCMENSVPAGSEMVRVNYSPSPISSWQISRSSTTNDWTKAADRWRPEVNIPSPYLLIFFTTRIAFSLSKT